MGKVELVVRTLPIPSTTSRCTFTSIPGSASLDFGSVLYQFFFFNVETMLEILQLNHRVRLCESESLFGHVRFPSFFKKTE